MQVVVLAGGLATRLGAQGIACPKVLQHVHNRPFADYLLTAFLDAGFQRFHFALGHLSEQVRAYLDSTWSDRIKITVSEESHPRGTAGALFDCRAELDDEFLVVMGDTHLPVDPAVFCTPLDRGDAGRMAVSRSAFDATPNVVVADGHVIRYAKTSVISANNETAGVDAGWLVLRNSALDVVSGVPGQVDLNVVHQALIHQGTLAAWVTAETYYDIGTPRRISRFADSARPKASR